MKELLLFKVTIQVAFLFFCIQSFAQVPFSSVPNSTMTINGELKTIGNSIVGLNETIDGTIYTPNDNYNGNLSNNQRTFGYIDVDNDQSTFSSSSAVFTSSGPCAKVAYAGLYWAASYFVDRNAIDSDKIQYSGLPFPDNRPDFRTLKLKPPGVADYIDIPSSDTQVIFDGYRNTPTNPENSAIIDIPYVCYADVTDIVKELSTPDGTYTVANMRASTGFSGNNTNGISGGWVLVIAYEDNSLSKKYISTRQGFISNQPCDPVDPECLKSFTYSGFQTPSAPLPVRARYAVATLEGDKPFSGDVFQIQTPDLLRQNIFTAPANPNNNFFDSSISVDGDYVTSGVPASQNTLGFDVDIFDIPNPGNTLIGNNQTSATFYTSSSGDTYSMFFNSFQVEIIEPELLVTERVLDANGIDITGESVNFADQLFYELTIENQGNEDITSASIRDILPTNVDFTPGSISVSNPGISVVPDTNNRELNITIDDALLVRNSGAHTVRFGVQVAATCTDLRDACSNEIDNTVTYTYTGADSGVTNTGESILDRDSCGFDIASPVNVLIKEDDCFTETEITVIVVNSITCSGGNDGKLQFTVNNAGPTLDFNYEVIQAPINNVIATGVSSNSSVLISDLSAGSYYIRVGYVNTHCEYITPQVTIEEVTPITVDIIVTQPTNQQDLGEIMVNALGGVPPYTYSINNSSPVFTNVFTNLIPGSYSIIIGDSNGCSFEDSVIINPASEELFVVLNMENTNIFCFSEATGAISSEVSGGSGNYTYTLTGTNFLGSSVTIGPKEDGFFSNLLAGSYLYKVESAGATPVYIPFTVSQPSELVADSFVNSIRCNGNQNGTIKVIATGGTLPYFFSLYTSNGEAKYIFIEDNTDGLLGEHTFENLSADTYRVEVEDTNGCPVSINDIIITEPNALIIDIITKPLTANSDAQITVTASGGTTPYTYELIDAFTFVVITPAQTSNIFSLNTAGNYVVKVQDTNGCQLLQEVTIDTVDEVPLLEYADEILFCAITGQSYPVISIQDQDGVTLEVSFIETASIVWQKLDDISCNITLENDCPTTDSSCSSNWFDIDTGAKSNIKKEGEYRIVITFANRATNNTEIYYFKAEKNLPDTAESFVMYPNPSEDIVNINVEVKNIKVFDVIGKLVLETTHNPYSISDLRNGIYFAKIETKDNKEVIVRVIKK